VPAPMEYNITFFRLNSFCAMVPFLDDPLRWYSVVSLLVSPYDAQALISLANFRTNL
jgi:hypothetical protein